jgi:hypothetical protein
MKHRQTRVEGREPRAGQAKRYEPVRKFERATSYCPLYLAWRILDEARDYFRTPIPEAFADKLAHRAEVVFAHHPFWQRRFSASAKASARQAILTSMRHWLAGVLARERPALFRDLPERFKVGHPLPMEPNPAHENHGRARSPLRADGKSNFDRRARSDAPHRRFVHGCELLPA